MDKREDLTDRHLLLLWSLADKGRLEDALTDHPGATYLELFDAAGRALNELEKRRHVRLFDALRDWRRLTAAEQGVPAYVVSPDKALWAIAEAHPQAIEQLPFLWGVGEKTAAMYGEDIIGITQALPEGDDVLDPLTLSLLRLLASGHGLWQIQEAYPSLEVEAIQERIKETLRALEFEPLPAKSVEDTQDDDGTGKQEEGGDHGRQSTTVAQTAARATPYRKRLRRGQCSWLGCNEPLEKSYYTYCKSHYDMSERAALEAEYTRADDQRERLERLRRMGTQNYNDPT